MLSVTSPAPVRVASLESWSLDSGLQTLDSGLLIWWLWVESNHQPRAYETLALIPLELHSHKLVSGFKFKVSGLRFGT